MTRRDLLAAGAALGAASRLTAADAPPFPGMTVRMREPENLETPLAALQAWRTPTEHFFVRSHFAVPKLDPGKFTLTVEGHVRNKLELSLDDIRAMPTVTTPLTLECAGNGRVFLVPQARGLQWGQGAVGNAEWTGTPLGAILDRAGLKAGAVDVVLVGADTGAIAADPATPGPIPFDRGIPLAKATKPEVLVAHRMNGAALTPGHGAPLRAVVGGWYGMAAVKWLTRVIVTDKPYAGYWQTFDYSYFERRDGGLPQMTAVTAIQPKAAVTAPAGGEVVPAGVGYAVRGVAWAGEHKVAKVEVSADGGATWNAAKLTGDDKTFCWRQWEWGWTPPAAAGSVKLVARATDAAGRTQPERRDADRRSYMINHLVPVEVTVR